MGSRLRVAVVLVAATLVAASVVAAPAGALPTGGVVLGRSSMAGTRYLNDVDCPSASFCVAVGRDTQPVPTADVVVIRNGVAETISQVPGVSDLVDVDCASVAKCVAVGSAVVTITSGVPGRPQPSARLAAVDCPSTNTCFAVGPDNVVKLVGGVIQRTRGIAPFIAAAGVGRGLDGVSCIDIRTCVVVGGNPVPSAQLHTSATAVMTDGHIGTPRPIDARQDLVFRTVSCASAPYCFVGGAEGAFGSGDAVRVDARTGAQSPVIDGFGPTGVTQNLGDAVCPDVERCVWAGGNTIAVTTRTSTFRPVGETTFPDDGRWLSAVSCPNAGACIAVGVIGTPDNGPAGWVQQFALR